MTAPRTQDETAEPPFRFRSLTLSVLLPTLLFAIGQGAILPYIVLFATDELGATAAIASLIFALRGIGTMLFDVPAGMMVSRFGERTSVIIGSLGLVAAAVAAAQAPSVLLYAVAIFAMGLTWSIWLLARLTFVSDQAPIEQRGRAIALLAGTNRIGNFVGPFLGAGIVVLLGIGATFYFQAALALVALTALVIFVRDDNRHSVHHDDSTYQRLLGVVRDHRRTFLTAGAASTAIHVLRQARQVIIVLWGAAIGLDPAAIGVIFGVSAAIDMLSFYPMGIVMDRFGRKWSAVPCLFTMAAGMIVLPLSNDFTTLLLVGLLLGLGNGFGSGIVMTLGADFSPREARGEFLGVWRLITDIGMATGPLAVAGLTAVATVGVAAVATGGIGILGGFVMLFLVPETLRRRPPQRAP